jgi:hypothetical protein
MKKLFALSILIPLAMVCSCQKQDTTAEQQLAQRKAELDAREQTLDEREKALAEKERALARAPMRPSDAQLRALQQRDSSAASPVPAPSIPQGLIPPHDPVQAKAERDKRIQERLTQRQQRLEAIQRMRSSRANPPADTSAPAGTSGSSETSAPASSDGEVPSPSPSATPQQ